MTVQMIFVTGLQLCINMRCKLQISSGPTHQTGLPRLNMCQQHVGDLSCLKKHSLLTVS